MNAQVQSDRALLGQYLAGDQSAISQLIDRHSRRVRDYIRMMVKDRDLADDILQDTLIKVVRVIDEGRYVDSGKFLSWILRIAHNQVIDHFRSRKQSRELNEKEAGYDMFSTIKLAEGSVEDNMVHSEMQATIRSLVAALPAEQREVVEMRYYAKLSFQEIADETGVSINTALGRMRYALINLRKMIAEKKIVLS